PSRELSDIIELRDLALPCPADLKLEPSPPLARTAASQSFHSLASSSDGAASLAEDPEENVDSQADTASTCTATLGWSPRRLPPCGGPRCLPWGTCCPLRSSPPTPATPPPPPPPPHRMKRRWYAFSDLPWRLLLNCVYCLGAERLQQMLFSDSPFMQSFLGQRKFTDVTLTSWSGKSKCHQSRVLSYTIPLSNPLGPKAAAVVETQTLFRASPDSGACVVDSEVITQGIPYQDYFYT
ncbi:hypothetical protein G0U57_001201, partial [Chelydra serpentina]